MSPSSVLLLGGSGSLGAATARTLRQLQPALPITIVGRDPARASALASDIGRADTATIDLDRTDLGLSPHATHRIVVSCLRDHALNALTYAQARGIPYIALSDAVFEIAPLTARFVHRPSSAPIVLQGHSIGAVPVLAALSFVRDFESVEAIEIGLVFDPDDTPGPMTVSDMQRIMATAASPLMLVDGRWRWARGAEAVRTFTSVDDVPREGQAAALLDTVSLAAATTAKSIRIDLADGTTASSRRGEGPSHEIIIEISGRRRAGPGSVGRFRYALVDRAGYAAMSARGVAVCIERILGLAGGPAIGPGLYTPEVLVDPAYLLRRLEEFGTQILRPPPSP